MEIFENSFNLNKFGSCVLALGNFDGVHIGHTSLFDRARIYAKENNIPFGVYTFSDSPKFKNADHSILTDYQRRVSLIDQFSGCDFLYFESFDDVKDFSPENFVNYIVEKFNCVCCVCGENFTFGKKAGGSADDLACLMGKINRECIVVKSKMYNDVVISSTLIKKLINGGDVETASYLLQAPYGFTSKVLHGAHIGHKLGFPTVNQLIPPALVTPKFGVYSTLVVVDGKEYMGVTNFGIKPTVSNSNEPCAETYIIDCNMDLYGKYIGVYFMKMLREEKRFSNLEELKHNIALDVENTKLFYKELNDKNEVK